MARGGQEARGWWSGKASVEVTELWEGACQPREQQVQRPYAQRSMSGLRAVRAKPVPFQKPVDGGRGGRQRLTFLGTRTLCPSARCPRRPPFVVCRPGEGPRGLCSDGASCWFGWVFLLTGDSGGRTRPRARVCVCVLIPACLCSCASSAP